MLEIKNLSVSYEKSILEDINLNLEEKIYGLVGSSGSGKTTFIKAISGLIKYKGSILLDGNDIMGSNNIQIVFQNPFNSFDAKRTIHFSINEILRLSKSDCNIYELLEKVGMNAEQLEMYPSSLSGGQLQRFSIIRALSANPKLILLDEPTSALDVVNQKQILDLLKQIKGKTVIFISHNIKVLKYVCDEIMYLDKESKKIYFKKI